MQHGTGSVCMPSLPCWLGLSGNTSFVGLGRVSKCEERLLQRLPNSAVRFRQDQILVAIQKFDSQTVEKVKKVADKPNAIKDNDFGPIETLVHRRRIFGDGRLNNVGRYENVVVYPRGMIYDFRDCPVDIFIRDPFHFHLVAGQHVIFVGKTDFNVSQSTRLLIGRIVRFQRFRRFPDK